MSTSSALAEDVSPGFNWGQCVSNAAYRGVVNSDIADLLETVFEVDIDSIADLNRLFGPLEANFVNPTARNATAERGHVACGDFTPPE